MGVKAKTFVTPSHRNNWSTTGNNPRSSTITIAKRSNELVRRRAICFSAPKFKAKDFGTAVIDVIKKLDKDQDAPSLLSPILLELPSKALKFVLGANGLGWLKKASEKRMPRFSRKRIDDISQKSGGLQLLLQLKEKVQDAFREAHPAKTPKHIAHAESPSSSEAKSSLV